MSTRARAMGPLLSPNLVAVGYDDTTVTSVAIPAPRRSSGGGVVPLDDSVSTALSSPAESVVAMAIAVSMNDRTSTLEESNMERKSSESIPEPRASKEEEAISMKTDESNNQSEKTRC
ncbi:unnamed protein product [Lupinus luteus]|uniref:Uncharacterized protein n=1 Tax=Lupinus luteus TaxID=3873 RepID=A0AAV1XFA5_LUPLU